MGFCRQTSVVLESARMDSLPNDVALCILQKLSAQDPFSSLAAVCACKTLRNAFLGSPFLGREERAQRAELEAEIKSMFWCAPRSYRPPQVMPSESWREAFYDTQSATTGDHETESTAETEVESLFDCKQFVKASWGWRRARAAAALRPRAAAELGPSKKVEEYIWPVRGAGQPNGADVVTRTVILVTLQGRPVLWSAQKAVSFLYEHELKDCAGALAAASGRNALPRSVPDLHQLCSLEELSRTMECVAKSAASWNAQEVESKGTLGLEVYTVVGPRITGQAPQLRANLCARGKLVLDNHVDVLEFVERRGIIPIQHFYFAGKISNAGCGRQTDFVKGQEISADLRMDIEKVGPNHLNCGSERQTLLAFPKCDMLVYC